ncbi:helix-turn-helix domain-containing protein [Xenorhabdus nematophila]|uniref:helix-turn-helix domain-containing protein n=1 Tax=Xenorhabdus nematophila TaxID=628 RepID=UPI00068ADFCF|nr:helix-turn-helix domain-containing protein [Xenorhabdus nematophila]AYA40538.1 helix-turn-helix domain-containing protein [Xenorhabdus nematophila]MBA0019274.1 helix-turn-helix domain-containing protein [Xenorhabdus nematophila]MCB4425607.1 helix-turn-helix domain-containing protein [Xenorhabdus nematophila]QNJ38175.1 helix-turn-helix domain-containing protein [Xenorhabdus nematophila]
MKSKIVLSEPERITLQQLALNHQHRDVRRRGTGLLMLGRGLKPRQIATETGCSVRVVYNWVHSWHYLGIAGLLGGHAGGRYPAMTPEMIATAVEAACAESLTLARIAQKVEEKHGPLPCTLETLSITLKKQRLTYKRARLSLKNLWSPPFLQPSF